MLVLFLFKRIGRAFIGLPTFIPSSWSSWIVSISPLFLAFSLMPKFSHGRRMKEATNFRREYVRESDLPGQVRGGIPWSEVELLTCWFGTQLACFVPPSSFSSLRFIFKQNLISFPLWRISVELMMKVVVMVVVMVVVFTRTWVLLLGLSNLIMCFW